MQPLECSYIPQDATITTVQCSVTTIMCWLCAD